MEHIRLDPSRTMAIEVLTFEGIELEKTIGPQQSFGSIGTLQVLYFRDYSVFMLKLNTWKYVLLKKLPIIKASFSYIDPVVYILPIDDGFFTLKFNKLPLIEALKNFETILDRNSAFRSSIEAQALVKGGSVPGLIPREKLYEIPEDNEEAGESREDSSFTLNPQSSSAEKMRKRDKLKKETLRVLNFISKELQGEKKDNGNMIHLREYSRLVNTTEDEASVYFPKRKEVEKAIMQCRKLIKSLEDETISMEESSTGVKGFFKTLKLHLSGLKEEIQENRQNSEEESSNQRSTLDIIKARLSSTISALQKSDSNEEQFGRQDYIGPEPSLTLFQRLKRKIPDLCSCGGRIPIDCSNIDIVRNIRERVPIIREVSSRQEIDSMEQYEARSEEFRISRNGNEMLQSTPERGDDVEAQPSLRKSLRESIKQVKQQVTGCVSTVAQSDEAHTLVTTIKDGFNHLREGYLETLQNNDSESDNRIRNPSIGVSSYSAPEDYQMGMNIVQQGPEEKGMEELIDFPDPFEQRSSEKSQTQERKIKQEEASNRQNRNPVESDDNQGEKSADAGGNVYLRATEGKISSIERVSVPENIGDLLSSRRESRRNDFANDSIPISQQFEIFEIIPFPEG